MKKAKTSKKSANFSLPLALIFGQIISYLICATLLLLCPLLLQKVKNPDSFIPTTALVIGIISSFTSGFVSTKKTFDKKALAGLFSGIIFCAVVFFISIFFGKSNCPISYRLLSIIAIIFCGFLGGKTALGSKKSRK